MTLHLTNYSTSSLIFVIVYFCVSVSHANAHESRKRPKLDPSWLSDSPGDNTVAPDDCGQPDSGDCRNLSVSMQNFDYNNTEVIGVLAGRTSKRELSAEVMFMLDVGDVLVLGLFRRFQIPRFDASGSIRLPCQFPPTTPATPEAASCCGERVDADGNGRCDPNQPGWNHLTWVGLGVNPAWELPCTLQFVSGGTGTEAWFELIAHCDLACDGTETTIVRRGRAMPVDGENVGRFATECQFHLESSSIVRRPGPKGGGH